MSTENKIDVDLLHYTPLAVTSTAIRTCWASGDKSDTLHEVWVCEDCGWISPEGDLVPMAYDHVIRCPECNSTEVGFYKAYTGDKDRDLIDRVGNKFKHGSTLEHTVYSFYIKGISRALLQELARHRIASLSVKSTRYTLKELKNEIKGDLFLPDGSPVNDLYDLVSKYCAIPEFENESFDILYRIQTAMVLGRIIQFLRKEISNDKVKYLLPESYKTELTWTINLRSLQNFLFLRLDKSALWEIQDLAVAIVKAMPEDHLYLISDILKVKVKQNKRIAELKEYIR